MQKKKRVFHKGDVKITIEDYICSQCKGPCKKYTFVWGGGTKAAVFPYCECNNKKSIGDQYGS